MARRTWTLLQLLDETRRFFARRGLDEARLNAELLLAAALDLRRLDLYLQFDRPLHEGELERFREYVRLRLRRMPLQYITGTAAFRHLELAVTPDALIPRPETEVLIDVALAKLHGRPAPRCLDLGCGAGAIALSLARELEGASVVGTDISPRALALARANAARCALGERVAWLCGDLFAPLQGPFDLIASNPPYVRRADIAGLAPEVRDYEPHLALDGGEDGLDFYRRISAEAVDFLAPGGHLLLEVGDGQAPEVARLLQRQRRYEGVEVVDDLNHIPRIVATRIRR